MKNFSELLDIDFRLEVMVNGVINLHELADLLVFNNQDTVIIDGIEILPRYRHLAIDQLLTLDKPFYQWYHQVSGQGWLLEPQM